jgi:hypothetical protein
MPSELGIIDLLEVHGFDPRLKSKLVRHQDRRYDLPLLMKSGWFELYQSLQARPIFNGCDQIVSFIGDGGARARFLGVYRVLEQTMSVRPNIPKTCPHQEWRRTANYFYKLKRRPEFRDLEGRVVIDWGAGTLAWHQHMTNKRVIEVLPRGRKLEPFSDYLDFTLTFSQLRELVAAKTAHRDWFASLSAVAGVYLVLAQTTGHQYVGSAYGLGGIWSRWAQYAASGHGGNVLLKKYLKTDSRYPEAFRFSVLQVLPKTTTPREVIGWETRYKQKLGSRATGLNRSEVRSSSAGD